MKDAASVMGAMRDDIARNDIGMEGMTTRMTRDDETRDDMMKVATDDTTNDDLMIDDMIDRMTGQVAGEIDTQVTGTIEGMIDMADIGKDQEVRINSIPFSPPPTQRNQGHPIILHLPGSVDTVVHGIPALNP